MKLIYENCSICPRECKVNREAGTKGICREDSKIFVSRAALHMWEEPCISGEAGSGAVFFSGCNMHCVFCQNGEISNGEVGKEVSIERLSEIFFELEDKGANNINLVTPTHYVPSIIEAAKKAKDKGLKIPFVYNTSGYEKPKTVESLKDIVDVFLPDFKYMNPETARLFSKAPDYPEVAKAAIDKMVNLTGPCQFDDNGIITKGTIVRILVLPAHTKEACEIIDYLYKAYGDKIFISIMSQYTPLSKQIPAGKDYDCLKRSLTKREYNKVINYAIDLGIKNAFLQEGSVNTESFIPSFDNSGV